MLWVELEQLERPERKIREEHELSLRRLVLPWELDQIVRMLLAELVELPKLVLYVELEEPEAPKLVL